MIPPPRSRIKRHVRARAGDLVPHELNARVHPDAQREALAALYAEVGFARSLLAYELPDGRLKLIDGHLRAGMDPDHEVEVEVLDVNDAEARKLLLSIDPPAQLVDYDHATLDHLRRITTTDSAALTNLWESIDQSRAAVETSLAGDATKPRPETVPEQYLVLVECPDEPTQLALLRRFQNEGLKCRALLS